MCVCLRMYVCTYVCIDVCTYVCMYVRVLSGMGVYRQGPFSRHSLQGRKRYSFWYWGVPPEAATPRPVLAPFKKKRTAFYLFPGPLSDVLASFLAPSSVAVRKSGMGVYHHTTCRGVPLWPVVYGNLRETA